MLNLWRDPHWPTGPRFDAPLHYHQMSEEDRASNAVITSDTCVIRNEDYFVRGCLDIPVHGRAEPFTYGVWVSLSKKDFERYSELFEASRPPDAPPFFGWFCNSLPGYPQTLNLKTNVYLRPYPHRPRIDLEPTDHPLALEQRTGITIARLQEIIEANEHPGPAA